MNHLLSVFMLLQEGGQPGGSGLGGLIVPMLLIFAIMYFLILRPQAKKQKQHQAMIQAIKQGDRVVTAGGIHGTVAGVKEKDDTLIVKIADNVKVKLSKASIARKLD
ncbi:MAG: preprotein translocase subunit YajC [bacterium]